MKPFEVAYFTRRPLPGQVSIERVFRSVSENLPSFVSHRFVRMPRFSSGVGDLTKNIVASRSEQSNINHITGDVHYLAAGLDPRRTVLTVHDCVSLNRLRPIRRALFRYFWYAVPLSRSASVTAPSEWTRTELLKWLPRLRKPVHLVPNPVPAGFEFDPRPFNKLRPTFLQIGCKPNKNLERTAAALEGFPCRLVVLGELSGMQLDDLVRKDIDFEQHKGVTDEAVVELYRACDAVLFASTYEGFGMPIIEANAIGRPIVTSRLSPMREVAGDAACLVDPEDVLSIREGIRRLAEDDVFRDELIAKGQGNAQRYRADRVAEDYLAVYQSVRERTA